MITNQHTSPILRLGLGLILAVASTQIFAHSKLLSSVPEADADLSEAPKQISLTFNENAVLKGLQIVDADNKAVPFKFKHKATAQKNHKVTIPALKEGTYTVKWKLLSKDRHTINGTYDFTISSANNDSTPPINPTSSAP